MRDTCSAAKIETPAAETTSQYLDNSHTIFWGSWRSRAREKKFSGGVFVQSLRSVKTMHITPGGISMPGGIYNQVHLQPGGADCAVQFIILTEQNCCWLTNDQPFFYGLGPHVGYTPTAR